MTVFEPMMCLGEFDTFKILSTAPYRQIVVKETRASSRRLHWPIGRAKPLEQWTICREDLVTVDEHGKEHERVDLPEFTAYVAKASAEKGYNFVGVQTFLGMLQAQKTRGNKRQGWTPDGQSLEAGA